MRIVKEGLNQIVGRGGRRVIVDMTVAQVREIHGLVEEASTVRPADLAGLARVDMVDTFQCEEGWHVQHLT